MSKICSVCGYTCEDAADFCPACGFTFSNPASAPVDQTNPQPNTQQVTPNIVQQNGTQQVPPNVMQQNFAQQAPPNAMQQNFAQQAPPNAMQQNFVQQAPPKKKNKTLWIVLGIVGGVLLLLFIIFLILFFVLRSYFSSMGIVEPPRTQGGSGISDLSIFNTRKDLQEYYYEDYYSASFNSEAFVDTTTEEPATEDPTSTESTMTELDGSSEAAESPDNTTNSETAFRPADLTLSVKEDDTILNMEESFHYIFATDTELVAVGNDSLDVPPGFEGKQVVTGRGITIGSTFDELIASYGINRNNAIWQLSLSRTSGYDYYYYSTTTKPDSPEDTLLMFGWYRSGGDWKRMTPTELNDYWGNGIAPPCDVMLMYNISFDTDYNVSFGYIAYGTPEWFKEHVFYD